MSSSIFAPTQPHSTDAEQATLGALLTDADSDAALDVLAKINPNDFYDPVHREIFEAILNLYNNHDPIDLLTVSSKLQNSKRIIAAGGSAYLAELTTVVPLAANVDQYAEIILEKSRRRAVAKIGQNLEKLALEEKKSAEELTEIAEQEVLKLSRHTAKEGLTALSEMRSERYDHYVSLYESDDPTKLYGIRTGFRDIDEKLTGLAPGQLIVLAGRPGMGKTALALDIAAHVACEQKKAVAIFSLEMSKEEVFGRLFAKRLGMESWKLEKGALSDEQFTQMGPVLDQFGDLPLYIDDSANSTLAQIRGQARRQKLQHGLDLLIIDYLQLIEVTDRLAGDNQTQRITYISKSLKQLARELHCPVLALSQLSRACDNRPDKRPQLSDLRDSGSIEQDGDRILMLYRESEYNEDCDDPDCTDVYIRKNRHGPKGHIELKFDKKTMTFVSVERS